MFKEVIYIHNKLFQLALCAVTKTNLITCNKAIFYCYEFDFGGCLHLYLALSTCI